MVTLNYLKKKIRRKEAPAKKCTHKKPLKHTTYNF